MIQQTIQKNITKIIIAVALTLAVTFSTGMGETMLGLSMTPSAHACIGSGSSPSGSGGGC